MNCVFYVCSTIYMASIWCDLQVKIMTYLLLRLIDGYTRLSSTDMLALYTYL